MHARRGSYSIGFEGIRAIVAMNKGSNRVYIVDDDKLVRFHLSQILTLGGYDVQAFESGDEFLNLTPPTQPACLLLDIQMPGSDGPSIQRRLVRLGWLIPVIFITAHATVPSTVKVVQGGALDVITKPVDSTLLIRAVENALAKSRDLFLHQQALEEIRDRATQLTEREREVWGWVISGRLNKEIAAALNITERTVKAHRASVMNKLSASSVVDLVRIADRLGIKPLA